MSDRLTEVGYAARSGSSPWEEAPPWDHEPGGYDDASEWTGVGEHGDDERAARIETLRGKLLSADDLGKIPPPEPLIGDLVQKRSLVVLYGKPGHGKSFVATDWGLSLATATRWVGHDVSPCSVLFVAAEGVEGLHRRVGAWQAEHQVHVIPADRWRVLPEPVNLFDAGHAALLRDLVAEDRYGFVVIDTLARSSLGADENSSRDMGKVIEAADAIRRASDATVLLVHHQGRSGENLRGSTAIDGAAATMWRCALEGRSVTLTCEKSKDTAKPAPVYLELIDRLDSAVLTIGGRRANELPDSAKTILAALIDIDTGAGVSSTAWGEALPEGVAPRTYHRAKKTLLEAGLTANLGSDHRPLWQASEQGKHLVEGDKGA